MVATDLDLAEYARSQNVADRNFSSLLRWAGYVGTDTPKPEDVAWVRLRIVAERIPSNTRQYVDRTMSWFVMDPAVSERLFQWLARNDPATEADLSDANRRIVDGFMPRFALTEVPQGMIDQWLIANGYMEPGGPVPQG